MVYMNWNDISKQNPWWADKSTISQDYEIEKFEEAPLKWKPRIKQYIAANLEMDTIGSIRGPRQVGKTTLMKLLIREKLEAGINPYDICYISCDTILKPGKLLSLLNTYFDWSNTLSSGRKFIFLDEISRVENWWEAIKPFKETHRKNLSILVSGSHSVEIGKALNYFTGRSGEYQGLTTHKILAPMKFAEYVGLRNPEIQRVLEEYNLLGNEARIAARAALFEGEVPKGLQALRPFSSELNTLFDEYLINGGVMPAVNHFFSNRSIPPSVYDVYWKYLNEDTKTLKRDIVITEEVLREVISVMGSDTNWGAMAKNIRRSLKTVRSYCYLLRDMFFLHVVFRITESRVPDTRAHEKKVFVCNPFFFHCIRGHLDGVSDPFSHSINFLLDTQLKSNLVEAVVGDHLVRVAFAHNPRDVFEPWNHLLFFSEKDTEVDYVLNTGDQLMGFEVKYQNKIEKGDFKGLLSFNSHPKIMLTKQDFGMFSNKLSIMMVPIPLYLMLV